MDGIRPGQLRLKTSVAPHRLESVKDRLDEIDIMSIATLVVTDYAEPRCPQPNSCAMRLKFLDLCCIGGYTENACLQRPLTEMNGFTSQLLH